MPRARGTLLHDLACREYWRRGMRGCSRSTFDRPQPPAKLKTRPISPVGFHSTEGGRGRGTRGPALGRGAVGSMVTGGTRDSDCGCVRYPDGHPHHAIGPVVTADGTRSSAQRAGESEAKQSQTSPPHDRKR